MLTWYWFVQNSVPSTEQNNELAVTIFSNSNASLQEAEENVIVISVVSTALGYI